MNYTQKVLTYKGFTIFEKISMTPFERIPKLFRENEACFMYIQQGGFSLRTPDSFITLTKGQSFLAKCFDYFIETNLQQRKTVESIEVIGVLLFPEVLKEIFHLELITSKHKANYNLKKIEVDRLLENFKDSIDILLDNPELADDALVIHKLKEFILLLHRTEQGISLQAFLSGLFHKQQVEFRTTILNNVFSTLTIEEFAHLCNMSVSTFKRKFHQTFRTSPNKYLTTKKLEKAASLLELEQNRIADVAYDCGFNSISSFNRSFKKTFGKTPSEYKLDVSA